MITNQTHFYCSGHHKLKTQKISYVLIDEKENIKKIKITEANLLRYFKETQMRKLK